MNSNGEDKKILFPMVIHDMRTPINGIIGITDIAIRNIDDNVKLMECLEKIDITAKHLLSLVNLLLDVDYIEKTENSVNDKPIDINKSLEKSIMIVQGELYRKNIKLTTEFSYTHAFLTGDELALLQIIINILGNAVKFTPNGGEIYFRVKEGTRKKNSVSYIFEIEDNGIGIEKDFINDIWDCYSREDNSSITIGSGLGMAITKRLVNLLNGDISVESIKNKGSKFIVELPFKIDKTSAFDLDKEDCAKLFGKRILIADDDLLNIEILNDMLLSYGVELTTVENGKLAVETFLNSNENDFDVILMDLIMPIKSGLQATKEIRSLERKDAKGIPIIVMTADNSEKSKKETLNSGINEYLTKPIDKNKLVKTMLDYI